VRHVKLLTYFYTDNPGLSGCFEGRSSHNFYLP
jgi:hypothetical protein